MEPFVGEIKLFAFSKVPNGWLLCDGTLLPINKYQVLFSLLGNVYGGDGKTNFALPDLRSRVLVGASSSYSTSGMYGRGVKGGAETVKLTAQNLPLHMHYMQVSTSPGTEKGVSETTIYSTVAGGALLYAPAPASGSGIVTIDQTSVNSAGDGAAHSNIQPYLGLEYCIAISGVYPPRQ